MDLVAERKRIIAVYLIRNIVFTLIVIVALHLFILVFQQQDLHQHFVSSLKLFLVVLFSMMIIVFSLDQLLALRWFLGGKSHAFPVQLLFSHMLKQELTVEQVISLIFLSSSVDLVLLIVLIILFDSTFCTVLFLSVIIISLEFIRRKRIGKRIAIKLDEEWSSKPSMSKGLFVFIILLESILFLVFSFLFIVLLPKILDQLLLVK